MLLYTSNFVNYLTFCCLRFNFLHFSHSLRGYQLQTETACASFICVLFLFYDKELHIVRINLHVLRFLFIEIDWVIKSLNKYVDVLVLCDNLKTSKSFAIFKCSLSSLLKMKWVHSSTIVQIVVLTLPCYYCSNSNNTFFRQQTED